MLIILWFFASLFAYIAGLVLIMKVTPLLLLRAYDEGLFMVIAAANVIGAMLAFGGVLVTFGLYSGGFPVRVLDFFLLVGILVVGLRMSYRSLNPRMLNTHRLSRLIAGSYCLLLCIAVFYCIVLLFE